MAQGKAIYSFFEQISMLPIEMPVRREKDGNRRIPRKIKKRKVFWKEAENVFE